MRSETPELIVNILVFSQRIEFVTQGGGATNMKNEVDTASEDAAE
jgi:hypothetical protein